MTGNFLEFRVRSGGKISIDLTQCPSCQSKACIKVCKTQGGPLVLDPVGQVPTVVWSLNEIESGGCVECLGCELDCELEGHAAVTIILPLDRFEEYLESVAGLPVYRSKG